MCFSSEKRPSAHYNCIVQAIPWYFEMQSAGEIETCKRKKIESNTPIAEETHTWNNSEWLAYRKLP